MYGHTSVLIMGEAKRRKNLGILAREKNEDINFPQLDKKNHTAKSLVHTI